mgnify:CR=1 FL=1
MKIAKLRAAHTLLYVVVALLITAVVILGIELNRQKTAFRENQEAVNDQVFMLQREVDLQKQMLRPVFRPSDGRLVLPEANISLPYNEITKYLQYSEDLNGNIRFTSALVSDYEPQRQLNCTELARINFTDGTPYSPWEDYSGEVQLENGQTMYIISAVAFESNEGTTEVCAEDVWLQVTPQQVADELLKAEVL